MKPHRVQLSRKKGWRMPPNTVKVDRTTIWGNPHIAGFDPHPDYGPQTAAQAVLWFRKEVESRFSQRVIRHFLKGKNLACWCKLYENGERVPCHADVLLEIANSKE